MFREFSNPWLYIGGVLVAVTAIYGSHLQNSFHFDDYHTIVQNPYVRDIHNVPGFFIDSNMSSVLPSNRVYRPILFVSLAIDYWMGHGIQPLWFHLSTLVWFVAQILLLFVLARRVFETISPGTDGAWASCLTAAVYGLHPVTAETINYVIQRAELQSTLGVTAGLAVYVFFPDLRKYYLYLIPVALGILSKPPALVFPVLLFLYAWLIEGETPRRGFSVAIPSIILSVALAILTAQMTPSTFVAGASSAWGYRIAQPLAIARYFMKFFVPTGLSADTDHQPLSSLLDDGVIQGFLFVAALAGVIRWTAGRHEWRPVTFGLSWFLVALIPTSVMPLAEVENDHRMFFPFVGLAIAVPWALALWLRRRPVSRTILVPSCVLLSAALGWGAWHRCEVWKTDESLWRDVAINSPHNGRGLMNYGLALMAKGDFGGASSYFERAAVYLPNYYILEINRGIVAGTAKNAVEAERRFRRSIELAPLEAAPKYYYARWLGEVGRLGEATTLLQNAIEQNPSYLDSHYLLMQVYASDGNGEGVRAAAQRMLARFPSDPTAQAWLNRASSISPAPEVFLGKSLMSYQAGRYSDSIAFAHKALELRPGYADAWNNIAAAYNAQAMWDEGMAAGEKAVQLDPKNHLARNNLAWSKVNKAKTINAKLRRSE